MIEETKRQVQAMIDGVQANVNSRIDDVAKMAGAGIQQNAAKTDAVASVLNRLEGKVDAILMRFNITLPPPPPPR